MTYGLSSLQGEVRAPARGDAFSPFHACSAWHTQRAAHLLLSPECVCGCDRKRFANQGMACKWDAVRTSFQSVDAMSGRWCNPHGLLPYSISRV